MPRKCLGVEVISIMAAMLEGEPCRFVLNLPNEGQVEDLPEGVIVETP